MQHRLNARVRMAKKPRGIFAAKVQVFVTVNIFQIAALPAFHRRWIGRVEKCGARIPARHDSACRLVRSGALRAGRGINIPRFGQRSL